MKGHRRILLTLTGLSGIPACSCIYLNKAGHQYSCGAMMGKHVGQHNDYRVFLNQMKGFPCSSVSKESACSAGDLGSLGREDPLEKEMATQFSILAWRIHGQRSLSGYIQSMASQESDMTEQLSPHAKLDERRKTAPQSWALQELSTFQFRLNNLVSPWG